MEAMNAVVTDIIKVFPFNAIQYSKAFLQLHKCGPLHQRRIKIIRNLASNIIRILVLLGVNFSTMPTHMIGNTLPKAIPIRNGEGEVKDKDFNVEEALEVSSYKILLIFL